MSRVLATLAVLALGVACARAGGGSTPDTTQKPADSTQKPPATTPPATTQASPTERPPAATGDASAANEKVVAEFNDRLKQYLEVHDKLEKTLPPLPKETNPTIIDRHQRALEALIRKERATAKRGDIFTPQMEALIRQLMAQVFKGAPGAKLKATIMDENPTGLKLAVNGRYPDQVPLSTMPPQVLSMLPKLPKELEYRFIGDRLILLDVRAHTIADYIDNVLP